MIRPRSPWPAALARLAGAMLLFGLLGIVTGEVLLCLFLGTLGYLGWNLVNQIRLERWLREGRKLEPPVSSGLWGEIFNGINRLQKRQRMRRRKLSQILQGVRETINAMPDGAVILRENGEIQWWNEAARNLLGLRWPQDEGQRIANLFRHPVFSAFIRHDHVTARSVNAPSPVNENLMLEIRVIPYGRNQRLLLVRDITRLHRLERTRRDFVANISHELRTPLTVIHGVAETLNDTLAKQAPQVSRPLELIEEQTLRMQRLVEDLLMLSRLETAQKPVQRNPVDVCRMLNILVEEARTLGRSRHGRAHTLELDCAEGLGLLGEESELRSAFSNLVFNAVKHTPDGGTIRVEWAAVPAGGAWFRVVDSGQGISAHHIPRLTERFYRVDGGRSSQTGGTGLGLAIVKHVLGRYRATLDIRSELGCGSTFSCLFPADAVTRLAASGGVSGGAGPRAGSA